MFKRECHLQVLVAPCLSNQQLKTPGSLQTSEKKNKPWVNELGKNTSDELVRYMYDVYLNSATNFVGLSTTGKAPITFALLSYITYRV